MIKELRLHDWKCFGDATLYIDPLTFVIGANASGKSNILEALKFMHLAASGHTIENVLKNNVRGGVDCAARKGTKGFSLVVIDEYDGYDLEYQISCSTDSEKGTGLIYEHLKRLPHGRAAERILFHTDEKVANPADTISVRFYTGKKGQQRRIDLSCRSSILSQHETLPVVKDVREACEAVANDLQKIFLLSPTPSRMRGFCNMSDTLDEDGGNIAGVLAAMNDGRKKEVEDKVSFFVRPLPERDLNRVWAEKVGRFGTDAMLYCEEQWGSNNTEIIDARSMSDGTLRFIAIVMALLTCKAGSLLVIEEIDNGLHPSRAGELVKVLKELGQERQIDLLCTTHNPVFIDSLGMEMLPFISYVSRSEDGLGIIEPVEETKNLTKLMANDSIGDLMVKNKLAV